MGNAVAILMLAVHLLSMNVAAAGPLVSAWLLGRGEMERSLGRRVARWSLAALGLGAALGGALLLAPTDNMRAALARFPASTYWFAASELVFSAACMMGLIVVARERRRPGVTWLLAVASATNLLYHFPPFMAVLGKLAGEPRWAAEPMITHHVLLQLIKRPEIAALWAHFSLASVAGAAIAALWPRRMEVASTEVEHNGKTFRGLANVALVASALQLPVGAWVLLASPTRSQGALMGSDAATTICFLAGVAVAIALLQALAGIALGNATAAMRRRAGCLLVVVAVLMSATLTLSRHSPSDARVPEAAAHFGGSGSF